MYWIEVTLRDSSTKKFEKNTLNEIYNLFGKYSRRTLKGCKATAMKFGKDEAQTGEWDFKDGIKLV
jgi:hypothetical protein